MLILYLDEIFSYKLLNYLTNCLYQSWGSNTRIKEKLQFLWKLVWFSLTEFLRTEKTTITPSSAPFLMQSKEYDQVALAAYVSKFMTEEETVSQKNISSLKADAEDFSEFLNNLL